jgi:hypothetical protein
MCMNFIGVEWRRRESVKNAKAQIVFEYSFVTGPRDRRL